MSQCQQSLFHKTSAPRTKSDIKGQIDRYETNKELSVPAAGRPAGVRARGIVSDARPPGDPTTRSIRPCEGASS